MRGARSVRKLPLQLDEQALEVLLAVARNLHNGTCALPRMLERLEKRGELRGCVARGAESNAPCGGITTGLETVGGARRDEHRIARAEIEPGAMLRDGGSSPRVECQGDVIVSYRGCRFDDAFVGELRNRDVTMVEPARGPRGHVDEGTLWAVTAERPRDDVHALHV